MIVRGTSGNSVHEYGPLIGPEGPDSAYGLIGESAGEPVSHLKCFELLVADIQKEGLTTKDGLYDIRRVGKCYPAELSYRRR